MSLKNIVWQKEPVKNTCMETVLRNNLGGMQRNVSM
jgi:hypothetical protein